METAMTIINLPAILAIVLLAVGCSQQPPGGETPQSGSPSHAPSHAYLIMTKEASGCLVSQTLLSDLTKKLSANEAAGAVIQPNTAAEDVSEVQEAYLAFPANKMGRLSGYLVFRVSASTDDPETPAKFVLDGARLVESDKKWSLVIEGSGSGNLDVSMMYSVSPVLASGWFSCPDAGIRETHELTFFPAYPIEGVNEAVVQKSTEETNRFSFEITPEVLAATERVDAAATVFLAMADGMKAEESPYVFDGSKLTIEAVRAAATATAGPQRTAQVLIKPDSGQEVLVGEPLFEATIRQKIAIRNADGSMVGGIVHIAINN